MHLLSSILSLLFVSLTINPGKTQIFRNSGKISNSNALQDFYRDLLYKIKDEFEVGSDEEQDVDAYILSHIINQLSHTKNLETSLSPEHDDEGTIQKRAKTEPKRAQDMSRLAMRILKRNQGMDSQRVAYRILKRREQGNNARIAMRVLRKRDAARIAMRVLRKRDDQTGFKSFDRVTRASPYSNIGGYFGGMSLGTPAHYPTYYQVPVQELENNERKRSECTSNCEEVYGSEGEEEET